MKKILAMLLALVLTIGVCMPALAINAQYSSTKAFLSALDEMDITYTVNGINDGNYEDVSIENTDDNGFTYTIRLFFDENEENCSIRVWNIIHFNDADFSKLLRTCNTLNNEYNYVCFSVDESDNTITATMDLIYRTNDVDQIVLEAILRMANILEDVYPQLAVFDK